MPGRWGDVTAAVTATLGAAGCVAAEEEAALLVAAAAGGGPRLEDLVRRRTAGEPLAWLIGGTTFCGLRVRVDPGVYVPRWQTETMARRAAALVPPTGVAVDLCTGAGAVAVVMMAAAPGATVLATDNDPAAVRCARANGVTALEGDLDGPLPPHFRRSVDVVTAVPPYVPRDALRLLPRDVRNFEPPAALDGGPGGLVVVERIVRAAGTWLRPGGALLIEIGGDQGDPVRRLLEAESFDAVEPLHDPDGDLRGVLARAPEHPRG